MGSRFADSVRLDHHRLARAATPLLVLSDHQVLTLSAGARPHAARLLACGAEAALPAAAAPWLADLTARGSAAAPDAPGLPGLRAERLDDGAGGGEAPDGPVLAALAVQRTATTGGALDARLAGLLDSARFIAMGELVDALEHRLNQPRATLRNRLAILQAARERQPERVPALIDEAYQDLEGLFAALAAFRAEIHDRIEAGRREAGVPHSHPGDQGNPPDATEKRAMR